MCPIRRRRKLAIFIVLACTLLVAIAQYLIKLGANRLSHAGLLGTMIGIFTIPQLFAGYCLYGVFTVLFVLCASPRRAVHALSADLA